MGFGLASFAVQIQQLFGRALIFLQVGDDEEGVQEKVIGRLFSRTSRTKSAPASLLLAWLLNERFTEALNEVVMVV